MTRPSSSPLKPPTRRSNLVALAMPSYSKLVAKSELELNVGKAAWEEPEGAFRTEAATLGRVTLIRIGGDVVAADHYKVDSGRPFIRFTNKSALRRAKAGGFKVTVEVSKRPRFLRHPLLLVLVTGILALGSAYLMQRRCIQGETRDCRTPDGTKGWQVCTKNETLTECRPFVGSGGGSASSGSGGGSASSGSGGGSASSGSASSGSAGGAGLKCGGVGEPCCDRDQSECDQLLECKVGRCRYRGPRKGQRCKSGSACADRSACTERFELGAKTTVYPFETGKMPPIGGGKNGWRRGGPCPSGHVRVGDPHTSGSTNATCSARWDRSEVTDCHITIDAHRNSIGGHWHCNVSYTTQLKKSKGWYCGG
jgi:hypothetical protein